jgi:hypothetical protein
MVALRDRPGLCEDVVEDRPPEFRDVTQTSFEDLGKVALGAHRVTPRRVALPVSVASTASAVRSFAKARLSRDLTVPSDTPTASATCSMVKPR